MSNKKSTFVKLPVLIQQLTYHPSLAMTNPTVKKKNDKKAKKTLPCQDKTENQTLEPGQTRHHFYSFPGRSTLNLCQIGNNLLAAANTPYSYLSRVVGKKIGNEQNPPRDYDDEWC